MSRGAKRCKLGASDAALISTPFTPRGGCRDMRVCAQSEIDATNPEVPV